MNVSIVTLVTYTVSLVSFFGFRFLTLYYQHFGYQLQQVQRSAEHVLLRGVDVIFLDHLVFPLFVLSMGLLLLASSGAEFRAKYVRIRLKYLALFMVAIILVCVHERVSTLAHADYLRDINAKQTTLSRLMCIHSQNQPTNKWFSHATSGQRKILVLAYRADKMVVFFAPLIVTGTPKVELFHVGITKSDIFSLVSGGYSGPTLERTKFCIE